MIEQIINWWNTIEQGTRESIYVVLGALITILVLVYYGFIRDYIKDKRKTTTQKYREGLIEK